MFASKSLPVHLARGVVGLGASAGAMFVAGHHPWLALAALAAGIFALRGCPSCWFLGLVQTVALGRTKSGACLDGSCAERSLREH